MRTIWIFVSCLFLSIGVLFADTFGSGANTFTIDFVTVGNAGNGADTGNRGGSTFTNDYGQVNYTFRMGTYEISQDMINKATNLGMTYVTAGAHSGNRPAASVTWYEAAAFVNFLNESKGHQKAYNLTYSGGWSLALWDAEDQATTGVFTGTNGYRHKDAFYILPSEDEWYKSAFHQNDGVTDNYWDFGTGSNTDPTDVASGTGTDTAVYLNQTNPADITQAGGLSPYGTMAQGGNVFEWMESAFDGLNNDPTENRSSRGGAYDSFNALPLNSAGSSVLSLSPNSSNDVLGFRVASIPEPSIAFLLVLGVGSLMLLRRRLNRVG